MNEKATKQVTNEIRDLHADQLDDAELDAVYGGSLWTDVSSAVSGSYAR